MNLSREYFEQCSAETGFQVGALEKVVRLGEFAYQVGIHSFLGKVLALKGGTALNLCFGAPGRLSVDLDFNYVGQADRAKMLEDRPRVESGLAQLASRLGYQVQQSREEFAGRKIFLRYRSVQGSPDSIEADINYLFRVPLAGIEERALWQPGKLDHPRIRLVSLEEVLIGKLLAFFGRCMPRDAWDLANLPREAADQVGTDLFRARFVALSATLAHPLNTYDLSRVHQAISDSNIANQLVPMLIVGAVPMRADLVEASWNLAGRFVELEPREHAYVVAVDHGDLPLEVLFPDQPNEAARLARHPALLWKIANVRAHLRRGS
jgi:predicted nucleotidyltransferase component of viral defense system